MPLPLWRLSSCNRQFSMCGTYPERLAVPASVDDTDVFRDSQLCDGGRVPMLLALFASGASLLACGQCATPSRLATVRAYLDNNAAVMRFVVKYFDFFLLLKLFQKNIEKSFDCCQFAKCITCSCHITHRC